MRTSLTLTPASSAIAVSVSPRQHPRHRRRTRLAVFMTPPLPLCANLKHSALLPIIDRRQAAQLDQKRRRVIHVLPFTLQPSLGRPGLRFANLFARFGFRADVRHGRTIRRGQPAPLPSPTTSPRRHLSTSLVSQSFSSPGRPEPQPHHLTPDHSATNCFRPAHKPHTYCYTAAASLSRAARFGNGKPTTLPPHS